MASQDIFGSIQAALDAEAAGGNAMDAVFGGGASRPTPAETVVEEGETSESDEERKTSQGSEPGDEDSTTVDGVSVEDPQEAEGKPNPDVEVVRWGGKEVKIDYSDRAQIKKDKALAVGARTWQAERDALSAKMKEMEPDYKDAVDFRTAITGAFEKSGVKGLVNLLTQDDSGYDKFIAAEVEKRAAYAKATPEQRAILEEKERLQQLKAEIEYDRKAREQQLELAKKKEEKAALDSEKANETSFMEIATTSRGKHTFAGTLDNADLESALDAKVWEKVSKELSAMPDNTEVTQRLMDSLYSKHYQTISKSISGKIEKQADKRVEEKKKDAQTRLSSNAVKNTARSGAVEEFDNAAKEGRWADMMKMAFGGKVKLR